MWSATGRYFFFFFFQAEDGIRDVAVTGVQTCALPISFGVKWLTDGMETSLAVLLALLLATTLDGDRRRPEGAGAIALLCVLVRPELAALVAVAVVGQLVRSNRRLAL